MGAGSVTIVGAGSVTIVGAGSVTIVGAGSVGLALAAQLARGGVEALVVTRSEAAAAALGSEGVVAEDLALAGTATHPVRAIAGVEAAAAGIGEGPVLICTRSYDAERAARDLAAHAPRAPLVCLCNGLDAEPAAARHAACVVGGVWRQTCTRTGDNRVRFQGPVRVVVGGYAGEAADAAAARTAALLRGAGLDVGLSRDIAADKWLKLCVNLMSAPNALVRRCDHGGAAFVEVKARLLEEARSVLGAAGIRARSCDGRDRSLDEEIRALRASLRDGTSGRSAPLYNSVWSALRRGLPLESVEYHRRILDLAARHGCPAPGNERMLAVLREVEAAGAGPESVAAESLL